MPNYYIRGAITQLDEGVIADSAGASIAGSAFSLGFSADQVTSVVSMDMNIGDLMTRQILPGMSAHNSISVTRTGHGAAMPAAGSTPTACSSTSLSTAPRACTPRCATWSS